jgi:hypothetical protein
MGYATYVEVRLVVVNRRQSVSLEGWAASGREKRSWSREREPKAELRVQVAFYASIG